MEKLLEIAKKAAEQVDIYREETVSDSVSFEDAKLKDVDSSLQSGLRLTLLKQGRLGSAYTRNLIDRQGLVDNALASLAAGTEAGYELPQTKAPEKLSTYDPSIEELSNTRVVDECQRACDLLTGRVKAQLSVAAGKTVTRLRVMNSRGTDLSTELSDYTGYAAAHYPGSYSSVHRVKTAKGFVQFDQEDIDFIADTYNASQKEAKPASGPTKVLFLPEAMYVLMWRIFAATNAKSFYQKVSPVQDKLNQKLFSEMLTITDEPLNDSRPGARTFDDEGTACRTLPIVEKGVLRNFYSDLYYAWKLGAQPSGHGFRGSIEHKATPNLAHITMKPGDKSLKELLGVMDSGVIVSGVLGAHSGNILNGDFSVGLAPGFRVEKGEITGHVKDAMVSGNIYDVLKNVVAVGDKLYPGNMGWFPAMLLADVNFAVKG